MEDIQPVESITILIRELKEYCQKELPYLYFDLLFFMDLCPDYFGRPVEKMTHNLSTGMVKVFFKQIPTTLSTCIFYYLIRIPLAL
ncbi:hypothetical protein GXP67_31145 [Rhodocytophaga rosea]|uniref:Uncharacterized protein n=1 Tax=Rhodocytophaga rosea TaxID=2704465 RepID=A0A6C0GRU4_9BACT|nr:hypothetical protein [Rhodocytophaga rosea]QHT70789.1 hypothetical protein GXP67_31145 [Rhodocytophaga rosea]